LVCLGFNLGFCFCYLLHIRVLFVSVPTNLNLFFCKSLLSTSSYIEIFLNCVKTLTYQTKFFLCSWIN
jgi:hypothetical protein